MADMVTFVRSRAASAGVKPPYRLLGMSLGGMVATDWSQRYPEEIERLVLIPNHRLNREAGGHAGGDQ